MSRKHLVVSAAAIGLVTLSACGNANQAGGGYVEAANAAQSEQVSLAVTQFDALGKVLTDQDGMTLYRFDGDSAQPPASNCDAECAAQWPPLPADGDVRVSGVAEKAIGSVTRPDGTKQVTVNGWPVYRYAMDLDPGTFNGQGTGGKWFVVSPQGTKAGQPAEQPAEQPTVAAADIPGFGAALTDENGMTLYLSTMDSKDPSATVCAGRCAQEWPPVMAADNLRVTGVDDSLMGTVTREDGEEQVTVGGWPVYRYFGDTAAKDTNGHGMGGMWYAIEPAGCKSSAPADETPEEAPETAQPDTGTGY